MKRYLAILAVIVLSSGVAGCETLSTLNRIANTTIDQPVTRKMYRNVSNGLILATLALDSYKNNCDEKPVGDPCDAVVERMQGYARQAKPVLKNLRVFVRKNDQVNARIAYRQITSLIADMHASTGGR